jgi:hypothetical protein
MHFYDERQESLGQSIDEERLELRYLSILEYDGAVPTRLSGTLQLYLYNIAK